MSRVGQTHRDERSAVSCGTRFRTDAGTDPNPPNPRVEVERYTGDVSMRTEEPGKVDIFPGSTA